MKKLVKVHMLPTEDLYKGIILLRHIWKENPKLECKSLWQYNDTVVIDKVEQYTTLNSSFRDVIESFKPQHLYFTSDEEIKKGDYGIGFAVGIKNKNGIYKGRRHFLFEHKGNSIGKLNALCEGSRKIVATTDKSLKIETGEFFNTSSHGKIAYKNPLPQIPQQFIEEYVKAGGIDEVYIDMEEYQSRYFDSSKGHRESDNEKRTPSGFFTIKLDSNNCVITHPVEPKLYTKEEVEVLMEKAYIKGYNDKDDGLDHKNEKLIDWIKENLK